MTDIPEIRMHERCATCAFRPGTEAAKSDHTQLKLRLCLMSATPFLCHEADRDALCAGYAHAITKDFEKTGSIGEDGWKRDLALKLLDIQEAGEMGQARTEQEADALVAKGMREFFEEQGKEKR